MALRVAFACAMAIDWDLLIVDEAMTVGDISFQAKCFAYIADKVDSGSSVILVSHSEELLNRFCDRGLLIANGTIQYDGSVLKALSHYHKLIFNKKSRKKGNVISDRIREHDENIIELRPYYNSEETGIGDRTIEIKDIIVDSHDDEGFLILNSERTYRLQSI